MSGQNLNSVSCITTNELKAKSVKKLKESDQIKLFDKQLELENNQLVQKSEKNNQCYICKTNFFSEKKLAKHFSIQHEGEKPHRCNLCDVKFQGKVALKRHLSTIHAEKIFNCSGCQKNFFWKDNLKEHLLSCLKKQSKKQVPTINEKKTQYCDNSKTFFSKNSDLVENVQADFGFGEPDSKKDNDGFANISAKSKSKVWNHFLLNRVDSKAKCIYCLDLLNSKSGTGSLHIHLVSKHSINIVPEKCDKIKHFEDKGALNKQFLSVHEEKESIKNPATASNKGLSKIDEIGSWQNGTFTCSICCKEFLEKLKLVNHVKSVHEKKEPDLSEHVESVLNIEDFGEKSDKNKLLDDHFEDKEALNKQCFSVHEEKESIKNPVSNKSLSKIDQIGSWQNGVFKCSICGKEFLEKLKLVRHVHEKNKPDLVEHLESVPNIEDFGEKSDNNKPLDDQVALEDNQLGPESEKSKKKYLLRNNQCYICKTNISSEKDLVKHFLVHHEGEKPYQCNLCDVKFVGKSVIKRHFSTIHEEKIFNCSACKKGFSMKNSLLSHLEASKCSKKQSKIYDAKNVKTASLNSLEDFNSITNYKNIETGMIKVKSVVCKEVTNFSDEEETNTTNYVSSLKNAQKDKSEKRKKMPQCYICKIEFSLEKDLMIHFAQKHEENQTYKCNLCDFKFKTKGQMKTHFSKIHEGKRLHCSICGKDFYRKQELLKHVESVHEKKKKCFCGSFFSCKEDLKTHMLSRHSGVIKKNLII